MRIPSGKVDQVIYFVALSSADLATRLTGLTSFTVYRSRNGGAPALYTTPTVTELSAANMPGVYALLVDEDTTIASASDSEEYCTHITQASMAPVSRTIELYRSADSSVLDVAAGVETGVTVRQALRIILASAAGKLSGAATTSIKIRDTGDAKDRITATVDASGNRTAVTLDAS